jgi:hypothetical protein
LKDHKTASVQEVGKGRGREEGTGGRG